MKTLFIPRADDLAQYITSTLIPANPSGFTMDPMTFQFPMLEGYGTADIYFVSLKGQEQQFNQQPIFEDVYEWVNEHRLFLYHHGHYIGGWKDSGLYYLDISIAVRGKYQALGIAHANSQQAIFNPFLEKTIYIPSKIPSVA